MNTVHAAIMDRSANPDVSVLIVAYNSLGLIEACLDSIAPACTRHSHEVLLVDNGDGSTEAAVARDYPAVRIVPSKGNIGFAAGNNLLSAQARAEKLLLLNPDMKLDPGAIDALLDGAVRHSGAAAWGGVTVNADGNPDSGNAIAVPSMLEFLSVAAGRSIVGSKPIKGLSEDAVVDVVSGGFVMFDRGAWEAVGGLDQRYFLYCEEVDLFVRLRKRGYDIWRIADARGYHAVGHGAGVSPMRLLYRAAGTMHFLHIHWSRPGAWTGAALIWLAALERYLAGRLLGAWSARLKELGEGYSFVVGHPQLWISGYDPDHGLLARLECKQDPRFPQLRKVPTGSSGG